MIVGIAVVGFAIVVNSVAGFLWFFLIEVFDVFCL